MVGWAAVGWAVVGWVAGSWASVALDGGGFGRRRVGTAVGWVATDLDSLQGARGNFAAGAEGKKSPPFPVYLPFATCSSPSTPGRPSFGEVASRDVAGPSPAGPDDGGTRRGRWRSGEKVGAWTATGARAAGSWASVGWAAETWAAETWAAALLAPTGQGARRRPNAEFADPRQFPKHAFFCRQSVAFASPPPTSQTCFPPLSRTALFRAVIRAAP